MVQAAGRLPSLNGDAIRYPAHAGSAAWMKGWPVRSSATPRDGDLRFGRVHRVSLSPCSCSWRRALVGRMPSRARTGDRADGELPLQDSNLDYLIQSQACCQLHQGAPYPKTIPSARPGERGSKIKTVGSGEWYFAARYRTPGSHRRVPLPTPHALTRLGPRPRARNGVWS